MYVMSKNQYFYTVVSLIKSKRVVVIDYNCSLLIAFTIDISTVKVSVFVTIFKKIT